MSLRGEENRETSPISEAIVNPNRSPTPGIVRKQDHAAVGGGQRAQLALKRCRAGVEQIDHGQRLGDRCAPRLRHAAGLEHRHRIGLTQPLERDPKPPLGEQPEDPVLRQARIRTRCIRRRSRSHSARSSIEGIHNAGTRSRRHNSASTRASTLSVLHASGATSRTLRGCATCTSQPASASRSRTHTAPLIISTHALTSAPTASTSRARPSSSAGTTPSPLIAPPPTAHHAARRYAQSSPRYRTTGPPSRVELQTDAQSAPGRPSFMTFHAIEHSGERRSRGRRKSAASRSKGGCRVSRCRPGRLRRCGAWACALFGATVISRC
jgi:hypothetical protein